MLKNKISVICPTFGRVDLLEEAVQSFLQQTYKNSEMIIVNDFEYQTIHFNHDRIKIFNVSRFPTLGEKRNFCISQSSGELITTLDDDDIILPDYLEHFVSYLEDGLDWLRPDRGLYTQHGNTIIQMFDNYSPAPSFLFRKTVWEKHPYKQFNATDQKYFLLPICEQFIGKTINFSGEKVRYIYRYDARQSIHFNISKIFNKHNDESVVHATVTDFIMKKLNSGLIPEGDIILNPRWKQDYTAMVNDKYGAPNNPEKSIHYKKAFETRKSWERVSGTWEKASSFVSSISTRGLIATVSDVVGLDNSLGNRVGDAAYKERVVSCFGDNTKSIAPCNLLSYNETTKTSYCNACGCGKKSLAQLNNPENSTAYTKLHYPYLECPLKKRGFSNYEAPISIIIPVLNDFEETNSTIKSIRETAGYDVEIIVVDDGSDIPLSLTDEYATLIRWDVRRGAGEARHYGATIAKSSRLLFIDSHMRFKPGWLDFVINNMTNNPKTLWCGICLGLNENNMDVNNPVGEYTGANMVFHNETTNQVFEGVWMSLKPEAGNYEIPCVMGACYLIHKDWFFHIRGLETNRMWGYEEPFLSLKTWLAGGEVRLMRDFRIGHKFRDVASYSTNTSQVIYNKIRYMYLTLPTDLYEKLLNKIPDDGNKQAAVEQLENDLPQIQTEKEYYNKIFTRDINWFCDKFKIEIPK